MTTPRDIASNAARLIRMGDRVCDPQYIEKIILAAIIKATREERELADRLAKVIELEHARTSIGKRELAPAAWRQARKGT